jgi:hypothetical protein
MEDHRPLQFSIRTMLLATLLVAMVMAFVRAYGDPVAPCLFGIVAAGAGYWLTVYRRRRRAFDVISFYFLGALAGTLVLEHLRAKPIMDWQTQASTEMWMFGGMVLSATAVGVAAAGWFRRRNGRTRDEADSAVGRATELRLERILRVRRLVLVQGAVLIGLLLATGSLTRFLALFRTQSLILEAAALVAFLHALAGAALVGYDVFRIGLAERGPWYAVGHLLIYVVFLPISVVLVPVLIQGDIER